MLSQEERKIVSNALSHMQGIADDTETIDDIMTEMRNVLRRAKGPDGTLNDVARVVIRQKTQSIINSLANCMDEANAIMEEF